MFKALVNTIFAEYPKELALTNQPPSGREGDREERWKEPAQLSVSTNNIYVK